MIKKEWNETSKNRHWTQNMRVSRINKFWSFARRKTFRMTNERSKFKITRTKINENNKRRLSIEMTKKIEIVRCFIKHWFTDFKWNQRTNDNFILTWHKDERFRNTMTWTMNRFVTWCDISILTSIKMIRD